MRALVLCLLCGCGRIGFEDVRDNARADAGDAGAPFVEAVGQLDATFGSAGVTIVPAGMYGSQPYAVVERADGGYFAVGVHEGASLSRYFGVFAFTQSGALDTTYGTSGIADLGPTANDFGYGAIRGADGRTALVGDGNDGSGDLDNVTVALLDTDGRLVSSFATNGFSRTDIGGLQLDDTSRGVAFLADRLVVCGTHDYVAMNSQIILLELGLDGTPLAGFGTSGVVTDDFSTGIDECNAVIRMPSGDLVVSGRTAGRAMLAAYSPDGTRDAAFASGGFVRVGGASTNAYDVALAGDGDLVTCGDGNGVAMCARAGPDGTLRTSFGQSGLVMVPSLSLFWAVEVQPNGKIVATGQTAANGSGVVVRLAADGTLDQSFGSGGMVTLPTSGDTELQGLLLQADGSIVTTGYVSGTLDRAVIARIR
ncbi:MAG TPA: delta-60 repeat domain-containing protein [Kofleriaceae bacterium]|nr:delta-60 repeat domain-containing protein [Kofleriaceae bacterium]